jgi:hypothetical protein
MPRTQLAIVLALLAGFSALAAEPRVDAALLDAARNAMPKTIADDQIAGALEGALWNSDGTAVAVSIWQPKRSAVFVFLRQVDGAFLACDASKAEDGNFGKLGYPRSDYERFETTPVKWVPRSEGFFQIQIRTRAWRGGQRYTVYEPQIVHPDGEVPVR